MKILVASILTAILLSSCSRKAANSVTTPDQPETKQVVPAENCDADFNVFFKKFTSDSIFQKKHMKFPVRNTFEDNANDDDYYASSNDITPDSYNFVEVMTREQAAKEKDKNIKITFDRHGDVMFYEATGIMEDITETMTFKKIGGCWFLIEIYDFGYQE